MLRARVTTIPSGKKSITATSNPPMITRAYWFPADDSEYVIQLRA